MSLLPQCARCGTFQSSAVREGICDSCREAADHISTRIDSRTVFTAGPDTWNSETGTPPFRLKDYELLSEIARGGMGIVFKARQVSLDRVVALKVIRSGQIADGAEVHRFFIEAKAAATLQHPNIVAIHEIGEEGGRHFFSMDFVEGRSLGEIVREQPLAPRKAAKTVRVIAEAVHYAHQRGILHRDLKPSNVLVDEKDQPRITDFGLAKLMTENSELTMSGTVMGSPSYMPPEQAEGRTNEITVRSDVYSLGAILYQLMTGRPPFLGDSPLSTMKLVVETDPAGPRQLNPGIPRDLETICLKCLEKNPVKRYSTAHEVTEELDRFLNYEPIRARSHGPVERTLRWCRRRPAVAAALLIFICGFIGVFWQWRRADAFAKNETVLRHRAEQASVDALLAQARVTRSSGVAGQRHQSLEALKSAASLRGGAEVRDEIVACLPLMDLRSGRILSASPAEARSLTFDSTLSQYAQGNAAGNIVLHRLHQSGNDVRLAGNGHAVTSLEFSPDARFLAAGYEGSFVIWEAASKRPLLRVTNLTGAVVVSFGAGTDLIAAGDASGSLRVYEFPTGHLLRDIGIGRACGTVRFDPGGTRLAVSSPDSLNLFVFNTGTGEEIARLPHPAILRDTAWNPTGKRLATACADNQVYVWDWERSERTLFRGHTAPPQRVVFSHNGLVIATIAEDKTLRVWEAATGRALVRWEGAARPILQFSADDRTLACARGEAARPRVNLLEVIWPEDVRTIADTPSEPRLFGGGAFSMEGRLLVVPVEEGLHLWDVSRGALLESLRMGRVQGVKAVSGGILTRGFYGVHYFPITQSELRHRLLMTGPPVFFDCAPGDGGMAVGDGQVVVGAGDEAGPGFEVMDLKTGRLLRTISTGPGTQCVATSADGNWIAASNWSAGELAIWPADGTNRFTLPVGEAAQLAFSPTGTLLAAATETACYLWRVGDWTLLQKLNRDRPGVGPSPVSFSPDGRILAWAKTESSIALTDSSNGKTLFVLPSAGQAGIMALQFMPGGGGLLVTAEGVPLTIWNLGSVEEKLSRYDPAFQGRHFTGRPWPESSEAFPRILVNAEKLDRTQRARREFHQDEEALVDNHSNFDIWRQMAARHSFFYQFSQAVDAYREALRLRPNDGACMNEMAYALLKENRLEDTVKQYQRILAVDPGNTGACQQLAYLYLHAFSHGERNLEEGRRFARQAVELDPENPASIFWLGVAECRAGKYSEALGLIDRALMRNPGSQIYLFYRAICLAKLGHPDQGRQALNQALERIEANPALLVEHREYFESFAHEARTVCEPAGSYE